eukprot:134786_1
MNRFIANCFVEEYDPTIEDGYRKQTMVGEAIFIWDIIHSSDYDTICQSIPFGHIFIFVYAINSRYSFQKMAQFIQQTENTLKGNWGSKYGIIVGNKYDLENEREVTKDEAIQFTKEYSNLKFMETSAKEDVNNNVAELFEQSAVLYMETCQPQKSKKKNCLLM